MSFNDQISCGLYRARRTNLEACPILSHFLFHFYLSNFENSSQNSLFPRSVSRHSTTDFELDTQFLYETRVTTTSTIFEYEGNDRCQAIVFVIYPSGHSLSISSFLHALHPPPEHARPSQDTLQINFPLVLLLSSSSCASTICSQSNTFSINTLKDPSANLGIA